jgi:hypothetical protein
MTAADQAYEALGAWRLRDEETGYQLRAFVEAVTQALQPIEDMVRDSPDGPGWSIMLDVDRVPGWAIPWLAQFVGVTVDAGHTEDQQRIATREAEGWRRGTLAAIRGAAKVHLTGSRKVFIDERTPTPYSFTVRTYQSETPDQAALEAALAVAKPAPLIIYYELLTGATYEELSLEFVNYSDLTATFPNYETMTNYVPGV